ncbi:MAG TPA: hypothetical protein VG077_10535 [Verrucomicrobiae bacterium]|nr:hypothetical protein [Verrucomicrobiae bacterium]
MSMTREQPAANQISLNPLRFEPIYPYRLRGGRRLANLLSAPLPGDGPIGEAWLLSGREDHPSRVAAGPLKGRSLGQLLHPHDEHLKNLSLLPTCGTKFYQYASDWKKICSEDFTTNEKKKIISSLKQALEAAGFKVGKVWGEPIEDRGSQIAYSALGQQAPIEEKKKTL